MSRWQPARPYNELPPLRPQEARSSLPALRAAIQAGIDGGEHPGDAVADIRAELGLPSRGD